MTTIRLERDDRQILYRRRFVYFKPALKWCGRWANQPGLERMEIHEPEKYADPVWTSTDGLLFPVAGVRADGVAAYWKQVSLGRPKAT